MLSTFVLHTDPMRTKLGLSCPAVRDTSPIGLEEKGEKRNAPEWSAPFSLITRVAEPGIAPGLEDYASC